MMFRSSGSLLLAVLLGVMLSMAFPHHSWGLASNNIPLDSTVYDALDKLCGMGLVKTDIKGLKPFSRAEVARLLDEAIASLETSHPVDREFAEGLVNMLRDHVPRELALRKEPEKAPLFDFNPFVEDRVRYVYLDGIPRNYNRDVLVKGGAKVFGFIGGNLRDQPPEIDHKSGTEGTPLLENNEGVVYSRGHNVDSSWGFEGFVTDKVSFYLEPQVVHTPDTDELSLRKGYLKIGGGGLELEAGRDANWFGPGYRGTVTLTNNAQNFDLIKLSSPEPVDVKWIKEHLGLFKYSVIGSRFDETVTNKGVRQPYFLGIKLALKPMPWFEIGGNFVRQEGGPGFNGSTSFLDLIFGGGKTNHSNTIAGLDMRVRIPWLRNTELYGEFAGEDSASFWPILESYVGGIYIPALTESGRDDFRFEYFWGHAYLYSDFKFPAGYVYHGLTPGHSQGGAAQDFFFRYSHWFSPRNNLALEYFHTERGRVGKLPGQVEERKDAVRTSWIFPVHGDFDLRLMYGWETITNLNLQPGVGRDNWITSTELRYRY